MAYSHGADSEVGRLRTVLVHRPGPELRRMTPRRAAGRLLFDSLPWVGRAQEEHDVLTRVLRDHGVEVLYLTELLQDTLEYTPARAEAIASALRRAPIGDDLAALAREHMEKLDPEALARALIAGLAPAELRTGRGVVFELLDQGSLVVESLANLTFCRDSSVWISDRAAVASLPPRRHGESDLVGLVYRHHPRFAGTKCLYGPGLEQVAGGDVLLLAPSVIAVGAGEQTTPAGIERLARRVFDAGLAHTMLAVPLAQCGRGVHLDAVCTVVDTDAVLMSPRLAFTLTAHTITPRADGLRVTRPQPFLEAAAQAMGVDRLSVIPTGLDPASARGREWDDAGNALAIDRGLVVCHERNVATNARLEASGIRVIPVPASELGSRRGGPRCMTCPVARDPAALGHRNWVIQLRSVTVWPVESGNGKVRHVELKVSTRSHGGRTIVSLGGEIDLYTAPRLHGELDSVLSGGGPAQIVVDMSEVEFCDSTGMNVLLGAHRRARELGGDLELAAPRPTIRKILQVTGLETVFTVLDDPATVAGQ